MPARTKGEQSSTCQAITIKSTIGLGTIVAMIGQGFFAFALSRKMITSAVWASGIIGLTSMIGKGGFVAYYIYTGLDNWTKDECKNWLQQFTSCKNIPRLLLIYGGTMAGSLTFAGLSNLSFENAADTLCPTLSNSSGNSTHTFGNHSSCEYHELAVQLDQPWPWQGPAWGASLVVNLISYPNIMRFTIANIKTIFSHLFSYTGNDKRKHYAACLLSLLFFQPILLAGLSNFYTLAPPALQLAVFQEPKPLPLLVSIPVSIIIMIVISAMGVMNYLPIYDWLMAITCQKQGLLADSNRTALLQRSDDHEAANNQLSSTNANKCKHSCQWVVAYSVATLLCLVGALCNTEQSELAEQPLPLLMAAVASPFILEMIALIGIMKTMFFSTETQEQPSEEGDPERPSATL